MPYNVEYNEDDDLIMVTITDEFSMKVMQQMARDVGALVQQTGCRRILNDLREADIGSLAIDAYNMPKAAVKAGVTEGFKRALLVGDRGDEFVFLETVFINRGHRVKKFKTLDEARGWLLEKK